MFCSVGEKSIKFVTGSLEDMSVSVGQPYCILHFRCSVYRSLDFINLM